MADSNVSRFDEWRGFALTTHPKCKGCANALPDVKLSTGDIILGYDKGICKEFPESKPAFTMQTRFRDAQDCPFYVKA